MASLYEMTQDVLYLQNLLESGEIDDQTYADTIEGMCVGDKIENICKMMKNLSHKAEAYKAEEDRMKERRTTIENGINRLKESLMNYMVVSNDKKVEAGLFTVSLGKSKSVLVTDDSHIPAEFLTPQPPKIDKTALGKALKAGEEIEGVELVEKPYVTIR